MLLVPLSLYPLDLCNLFNVFVTLFPRPDNQLETGILTPQKQRFKLYNVQRLQLH